MVGVDGDIDSAWSDAGENQVAGHGDASPCVRCVAAALATVALAFEALVAVPPSTVDLAALVSVLEVAPHVIGVRALAPASVVDGSVTVAAPVPAVLAAVAAVGVAAVVVADGTSETGLGGASLGERSAAAGRSEIVGPAAAPASAAVVA